MPRRTASTPLAGPLPSLRATALAAALLGAACSPPTEFERQVRPARGEAELFDLSTAERLVDPLRGTPDTADANVPATPPPAGGGLTYEAPAAWEELPPTPFRNANFRVPGNPPAECTLSLLPGEAGGLVSNVNRWVADQMGQAPLEPAAIDALPRRAFFGGQATLIDVSGSFAGMGSGPQPGFRMVGLLLCEASGSKFLKLVGPEAAVAGAVPAFFELADSMRLEERPEPVLQPGPQPGDGQALGFVQPDGWEPAGDRPMRVLNFEIPGPAGVPPTEAYVTILGRDGGGDRSNFDRWRTQMGQPALTDAEFEGLERLPMLGTEAAMIRIPGSFTGMNGETIDEALMLGAIALLGDRAVFVKLIGPRDTASEQLESFRTFCRSLLL